MANLIIIMGVASTGKSVVGHHLEKKLGIAFIDGDDLHPEENVRKMSAEIPLTDADRQPWLKRICQLAESYLQKNQSIIITCSALKASYRNALRRVSGPVLFVYLKGTRELIQQRMLQREGHFMPVELLQSQCDDLEDPTGEPNVVTIDIDQDLETVLAEAKQKVLDQLKVESKKGET